MKRAAYLCAAATALAASFVLSSCCALGAVMHAAHGCGDHGHGTHEAQTTTGLATQAAIGDQVVCPVDGMQLQVAADTPATEFRGRTYYFCSDADQRAFLKEPERYAAKQ